MLEESLWKQGKRFIGGVDEAGRGPLAGPLVSCCVIFPPWNFPPGLTDSKLLSSSQRERLFELIYRSAFTIGVSIVGEKLIDCLGVQKANIYSFREAVYRATVICVPDFIIFDWVKVPELNVPSLSTSQAETKSYSVAAASIVSKVLRDSMMITHYQPLYPEYGFVYHKGYGTKMHREKLNEYGLSECHRRTFCGKFL